IETRARQTRRRRGKREELFPGAARRGRSLLVRPNHRPFAGSRRSLPADGVRLLFLSRRLQADVVAVELETAGIRYLVSLDRDDYIVAGFLDRTGSRVIETVAPAKLNFVAAHLALAICFGCGAASVGVCCAEEY